MERLLVHQSHCVWGAFRKEVVAAQTVNEIFICPLIKYRGAPRGCKVLSYAAHEINVSLISQNLAGRLKDKGSRKMSAGSTLSNILEYKRFQTALWHVRRAKDVSLSFLTLLWSMMCCCTVKLQHCPILKDFYASRRITVVLYSKAISYMLEMYVTNDIFDGTNADVTWLSRPSEDGWTK